MKWEPVIGLEVHVQLATTSKAFAPSGIAFGAEPNTLTDPVVLGLPGALPVYNQRALEEALKLGLATRSQIRPRSRFARKHYFYPDLPKGYQISQYDEPLCYDGVLDVLVDTTLVPVPLERIHLEEDAGKSSHHGPWSWVDLNRAGIPLVEVVTRPTIYSADVAAEFMRSLHRLVCWLGVSEGDLEKGHLRCDANVSIRPQGSTELGVRTELKNINSFRFVKQAIEHEIARQIELVEAGGRITRETRLWDGAAGTSQPLRNKEEANDYRYFPDPDLPPLELSDEMLAHVRASLPSLPAERFAMYQQRGVADADARTLVSARALADYFDREVAALAAHGGTPATHAKLIANWLLSSLLGALHREGLTIEQAPLPPGALAELVMLIERGTINGKLAKEVFEAAYQERAMPSTIVAQKGLQQIDNADELRPMIAALIAANGKQAEAYRAGNEKMLGYFVGQVMKATGGKANPALVNQLLREALA